jgi:hypothetical protein
MPLTDADDSVSFVQASVAPCRTFGRDVAHPADILFVFHDDADGWREQSMPLAQCCYDFRLYIRSPTLDPFRCHPWIITSDCQPIIHQGFA